MNRQLVVVRLQRVEALLNSYARNTAAHKLITSACDDLCLALYNSTGIHYSRELINSYINSPQYALLPVRRIVRALRTLNPNL